MSVHVGSAIAQSLSAHGVPRVFLVPGESFLPVLDGLHDLDISTVVCRHEGGAAYMADAHGKFTGMPGVAMVTRGPGAANAFVGIHTAWQDATPLVLFIGLIPLSDRDRESFQEFDPKAWFGTQAKKVFVLDDPARASEVVAEAFFIARSGRPGPVIVGLPEDILYEEFAGVISQPLPTTCGAVSAAQLESVTSALSQAEKPLFFVGGSGWSAAASAQLSDLAHRYAIPVVHDWRAADRMSFDSPANAGWLGYGRDDAVVELVESADLIVQIGAHLSDVPTDGFRLRQGTGKRHIVVSLDTQLTGNATTFDMQILASPAEFITELSTVTMSAPSEHKIQRFRRAHDAFVQFASVGSDVDEQDEFADPLLRAVFGSLQDLLPQDAVFSFGAGNHCIWAQRFLPTRCFPSQLSVRNGSMGYSVPAAVAASLESPGRTVVAIAGDGEFLMNGQELATAVQCGASFVTIVLANGEFGTIRDHQENHFPNRVSGTQLRNPRFATLADGFGCLGVQIAATASAQSIRETVEDALVQSRAKNVPVVIEVPMARKFD